MKFVKLRFPKDGETQWRLIIDNIEDLAKYREADIEATGQAIISMPKDFGSESEIDYTVPAKNRAEAMSRMIDAKARTTPVGEKVYPLVEMGLLLDKKAAGMLKVLNLYGAICVTQAGGYCGYEDFLNTWNAEVVETIEKGGTGFPSDGKPFTVDTLIIENSATVDTLFMKVVEAKFPKTSIGSICRVPETDERYLLQCISNAKNIAISTQASNAAQVDSFINMFLMLKDRKNVYIQTVADGKERIESHPKFKMLQHSITIQKF